MDNVYKKSLELHKKLNGKIEIGLKKKVKNKNDLSLFYSPGVAEPCRAILKNPKEKRNLTINGKCIAVITDGSSVLGLGNIGAEASLPVMEGKCLLFKHFSGINSFPIAINTQDTKEFVNCVKLISKSFAGINLEDISAPRCFEIEETLKRELDIPVFHDDQHGTAIVVLAGLINSLKVCKKKKENVKVVINGFGAAGYSIFNLLKLYGFKNIDVLDSKGLITSKRSDLNKFKKNILSRIESKNPSVLKEVIKGADIFIGVSKKDVLTRSDVLNMKENPIVFSLANPEPEIKYEKIKDIKGLIYASGRSDIFNQVNNVLAFPGVFYGAIKNNVKMITDSMKIKAAVNLSKIIKNPNPKKIIPSPFEKNIYIEVSKAIK